MLALQDQIPVDAGQGLFLQEIRDLRREEIRNLHQSIASIDFGQTGDVQFCIDADFRRHSRQSPNTRLNTTSTFLVW